MCEHILTPAQAAGYGRALLAEERAAATIEKYLRDIRAFMAWLGDRPVTKEAAAQWKNHLLVRGQAPATVNAKLSALNGLFRYLGWEECRVKFLRIQRRIFRDASRELVRADYDRLLAAAGRGRLDWLELVMQAICSTGIRVSEVRYITVEAAAAGKADVTLKGKIRTILLPGKLCRKLLKYARRKKIASGEIFLAEDGSGISRGRIWREMKRLCETAGVSPTKVFPHNLRHLFAVTFYRVTRDIVKLADVLGHSSINTTRIYLLSTGFEHARQMEQLGLVT